jgi:hypothetical protein
MYLCCTCINPSYLPYSRFCEVAATGKRKEQRSYTHLSVNYDRRSHFLSACQLSRCTCGMKISNELKIHSFLRLLSRPTFLIKSKRLFKNRQLSRRRKQGDSFVWLSTIGVEWLCDELRITLSILNCFLHSCTTRSLVNMGKSSDTKASLCPFTSRTTSRENRIMNRLVCFRRDVYFTGSCLQFCRCRQMSRWWLIKTIPDKCC